MHFCAVRATIFDWVVLGHSGQLHRARAAQGVRSEAPQIRIIRGQKAINHPKTGRALSELK
jgi:hypothetical protein